MTPGGGGTATDTATSRSTRRRKSSTASSGSGSERKGLSIDAAYRSILDQDHELKYARREPRWVLANPATVSELTAMAGSETILVYMTDVKGTGPALVFMGIPIKSVPWMPEGIFVVTDTYLDVPSRSWADYAAAGYFDSSKFAVDPTKITGSFTAAKDYKISFDSSTLYDSYTTVDPKWFTFEGKSFTFSPATSSGIGGASEPVTMFDAHDDEQPEEGTWTDCITESQDPDPDSIYGKALARAREPYKTKAAK
jgi:hypothetical protein